MMNHSRPPRNKWGRQTPAKVVQAHARRWALLLLASFGLTLAMAGCARDPEVIDLGGAAQLVRHRVMEDFAKNPAWARRKYSRLFEGEISSERNQAVAMIAACASVESNGLPLYHGCRDFMAKQLKSDDAELRGMALSALVYRTDDDSVRVLLEGYDEPDDEIHMRAASALQGRLDSLKGTADTAAVVDLSRRIHPHCKPEDSSMGQELCAEVASHLKR